MTVTTAHLGLTLAQPTDVIDVSAQIDTPFQTIDALLNSTTPSTQTFPDTATYGTNETRAARGDHKHAMPSLAFSGVTADAWTSIGNLRLRQSGFLTTVTNTYSVYAIVGKIVFVQFSLLVVDATGAVGGNTIQVASLPGTIQPLHVGDGFALGSGAYLDAGSRYISVTFEAQTTTRLLMRCTDASAGAVGGTPNITAAAGDTVAGSLVYELA